MTAFPKKAPAPGSRLPATPTSPENPSSILSKRREIYASLLVLAMACGVGWWIGSTPEILPPPNGGLVVDEKELDFGEVWEDSAFPWKFTIHNPTANDIEIKKLRTSCSCAGLDPDSLTVRAGGSMTINLLLDLGAAFQEKGGQGGAQDKIANRRPFDAEVYPEFVESIVQHGQAWRIKGQVARILAISPPSVQVTEELIRGADYPRQELHVKTHAVIHSLTASCDAGVASVRRGSSGADYIVEVQLSQALPSGRHRTKLVLQGVGPELRPIGRKIVSIEALVVESVSVAPSALIATARVAGEVQEENIVLASRDGRPFSVAAVTSTSPLITADPSAIHPHEYRVKIGATGRDAKHHSIGFQIESMGRRFEIRVPVYEADIHELKNAVNPLETGGPP